MINHSQLTTAVADEVNKLITGVYAVGKFQSIYNDLVPILAAVQDTPIVASRSRFIKYGLTDLTTIKIDVQPQWPATVDAHDRSSTATDLPVWLSIQARCEKTDDERADHLTNIGWLLARFLSHHEVPDAGRPIEPLLLDRVDNLLDQGHFAFGGGIVYRIYADTI